LPFHPIQFWAAAVLYLTVVSATLNAAQGRRRRRKKEEREEGEEEGGGEGRGREGHWSPTPPADKVHFT